MQTLNQSLPSLYLRRVISVEDALARSADPLELQRRCRKCQLGSRPEARIRTAEHAHFDQA